MPPTRLDTSGLRLGDYDYTTSPRKGYVDLCHLPGAGNPVTTPPWVDTANGTWSAASKVAVEGDVRWPSKFTVKHAGSRLKLSGNGLPPRSGEFPVGPSDPAHAYNPDPEAIKAHSIGVSLPYEPKLAGSSTCVGGIVGMVANGIPLLDGFDAGGRDAGAEETQDTCHGHPNPQAGYHYHSLSPCLLTAESRRRTTQVGWAFDGFGIYVEYDKHGDLLTNSSLDACHGRTSIVPWHGREVRMYHYDMTYEFPYSVACFRGTPVPTSRVQGLGYMGS
jgi:hypothetical protein